MTPPDGLGLFGAPRGQQPPPPAGRSAAGSPLVHQGDLLDGVHGADLDLAGCGERVSSVACDLPIDEGGT